MAKRKKKLSKKDRNAIIGSIVVFLVLMVPFILKSQLTTKEPLDERTLCPAEGESHRTTVLIDKSDRWGANDVRRINDLLTNVYLNVPAQGRLTIYGIVGDARETTEVRQYFDLCNPGSEKECNALYQDCGAVKERFAAAFSEPLETLAAELKVPGQSSYSPLLESVSEIVDEAGDTPLDLLIVSDMMENHYKFRFYDVVPLADEMIAEYPLTDYGQISASVRYIQRSRHSRELERAVLAVWKDYFEDQGIPVEVDRLFTAE